MAHDPHSWRSNLILALAGAAAAAVFGAAMGTLRGEAQPLYGAAKMPAFFLATWAITFPACHVLALLLGESLRAAVSAGLVLRAILYTSLALSGFATVDLFLGLSVGSEPPGYRLFIVVQVLLLAGSGLVGVAFLARDLRRAGGRRPALTTALWGLVYGFVGSQWAWTLRPWIGHPDMPVEFLRWGHIGPTSDMNFYTALWWSLRTVLGL